MLEGGGGRAASALLSPEIQRRWRRGRGCFKSPGVKCCFFKKKKKRKVAPLKRYSSFPRSWPLPPRPVENDHTLRIKNEKTRSLLLFTNVTEKHFGNYTCFASNRLGASNASMLLFRKSQSHLNTQNRAKDLLNSLRERKKKRAGWHLSHVTVKAGGA